MDTSEYPERNRKIVVFDDHVNAPDKKPTKDSRLFHRLKTSQYLTNLSQSTSL